MKKLLTLLLILCSLTTSALASGIPHLDKVAPAYRDAAQNFMFLYTSDADLKGTEAMQKTTAQGRETITVPAQGADPAVNMYVFRPQNANTKTL